MLHLKIPTPEEVDYDNNEKLEKYLEFIKNRIVNKQFRFQKYNDISDFIPKIDKIISEFGWKITEVVEGLKEDYHVYYEIKPLKNRS